MLRELVSMAGAGGLILGLLAVVVKFLVDSFLGWEHRRSERRRQFLELWPKRVEDDELWSDVALRHLTGAYLPRKVVNVVLAHPDQAATLIQLASVWHYLVVSETRPAQLGWKRKAYAQPGGRARMRWVFNIGYFALSWLGSVLLMGASRGPVAPVTVVWGIFGALLVLIAMLLLVHEHRLKDASDVAPPLIARVNSLLDERRPLAASPAVAVPAPVPSALP